MAASDKDTIYIDIDDEITTIIDKFKASDGKVVALVLPKRAAVFQSIVNMKLLKRAADSSKKHLVLITSEAGLLPLAGAAGVHVAKTLTSKPEIPLGPSMAPDDDEPIDEDSTEPVVPLEEAANMPIGKLAGATAVGAVSKPPSDDMETLELDDEDLPPEEDMPINKKDFTPPPKGKKNKKLHVPNFERFRLLLVLGVAVIIALIGGFVFANYRLAKATINITTDASNVDANADINLSTTAKTFSANGNVVPAKLQQQQKTYTAQVATTGQTNHGNKASGTITLTNCSKQSGDINIPSGSSFSTNGSGTFITQKDVTVPESNFNFSGTKCTSSPSVSVEVVAQSPGTAANNASSFTGGSPYGGITGTGSTSGGTDNIVQTVNQNDINSAKSKIALTDLKQSLQNQLEGSGYQAIVSTYIAGAPAVTQSAQVGDQASSVTVTEVVTYTMFGVQKSDLQTVIKTAAQGQIDTSKQSLLDYGLNKASFTVNDITATGAQISMSTKATVGPDLSVDTIKQEAAGQHIGEIKARLSNNPDVTGVEVKLSPFWVTTVPKQADKITVNIAKPKTTTSSPNANQP